MVSQQLVRDFSKILQIGEIELTKEYLKQFVKARNDYEIAKNVYDYLVTSKPTVMNLGKVKGSDKNFPYCERNFTIDGVDEKEMNKYQKLIDNAQEDVYEKSTKYNEMKVEVDLFMLKIPNEKHREIFKMIFVDDKKNVDVARMLNYSQPRITQIINEYVE